MSTPDLSRMNEVTQAKTLAYPLTDDLNIQLALRFVKYSRYQPADSPTESTTTIVYLPIPDSIPENISLRTDNQDLRWLGALSLDVVDVGTDLGKAPLTDLLKQGLSNISAASAAKLAVELTALNENTNLQVNTGKVLNPHTTTFFGGVNLRSFTLSWRFSPSSQAEAQALNNIYDEIEMRSHPEELAERLVLDYPDLVYVDFIGDSKGYFPKYRKAFISSIQRSFKAELYPDNAPVEQEYSVTFNEVEVVTRNILRGSGIGSDIKDPQNNTTPPPSPVLSA